MLITLVIIPAFVTFLAFQEPKKQVLSQFLTTDLFKLVNSLMERFVKSALLKLVTSAAKLPVISIDISKLYCGLF